MGRRTLASLRMERYFPRPRRSNDDHHHGDAAPSARATRRRSASSGSLHSLFSMPVNMPEERARRFFQPPPKADERYLPSRMIGLTKSHSSDTLDCSSLSSSLRSASDWVLEASELDAPLTTHQHQSRRVSFGAVHVREYSQILGDHPCCETGCPLSLGWDYRTHEPTDISEGTKSPLVKLTLEERKSRLADTCSDADIRRTARRRHRDRECNARANRNFFKCSAPPKPSQQTDTESTTTTATNQ